MFQFSFTPEQLAIIGNALAQMPWHIADPIIKEINRQAAEQQPE